jgi:hypothetical protein
MTLGEIRGEIYSRYTDQLLGIGDGAGYVAVDLKATATAAAAEIVGRYGSAVRVDVGFFPYPPPPSPSGACDWVPKPSVDPGSLRAVIELPSTTITHSVGLRGKVRITNTGSKTITFDTGQPLSIYLFTPTGAAPIGASSGAVAGTGLGLKLLPAASQDVDAFGGTASCDLALGYELPDGPYVARAAVEVDGSTGPGFFWSDPMAIQLVTQ